MGFFLAMFCFNLVIPVTMILAGRWMVTHTPKQINSVLGYRTRRSMKNMDTWRFAHDYAGRLWVKLGLILVIPTIAAQLPFLHAKDDTIGIIALAIEGVQLLVLVGSIWPVEKALERSFDEYGRRIDN